MKHGQGNYRLRIACLVISLDVDQVVRTPTEPLPAPSSRVLPGQHTLWAQLSLGLFPRPYTVGRSRAHPKRTVDPENRELRDYFEGVHEPPSFDPAKTARWLEDFIAFALDKRASAAVDFGGGDTTLGRLAAESPDLAPIMGEAGVSPVAVDLLGPRLANLSPLATLENAGLRPRAHAPTVPPRSRPSRPPASPRRSNQLSGPRPLDFRSRPRRGRAPPGGVPAPLGSVSAAGTAASHTPADPGAPPGARGAAGGCRLGLRTSRAAALTPHPFTP